MKLESNTEFGQYRLVRLLGRGGMGEVYEAEHTTLGRSYALKLLPTDFAARPEALARFRREARVMANLEHPRIVRVDEFGETGGRYWLRMELVKGVETDDGENGKQQAESGTGGDRKARARRERCVTLGEYAVERGGKIDQEELIGLLSQLLDALAYAHEKGVVHRDLKPANILLETDARGQVLVKVSDFGLALVIGEEFIRSKAQSSVSRSMSLGDAKTLGREKGMGDGEEGTSTRALLGTWEYMSPEQQRGEEANAKSDVYSVGLMCYRLLTGRELGLKKPSQLVADLQEAWDTFIACAVEQDAGARYASGRAMLEALATVHEALEREKQDRRQKEDEQRQREAEAAREREVEAAARARGEEWVLEEERAAKAWQAQAERAQRELQAMAKPAVPPPLEGLWLEATEAGIKFACPHCGQHLEVAHAPVCSEISCPTCRKLTLIPTTPAPLNRTGRRM